MQPTPRWEVTSDSVVINLNDYAIARNMLLRVKGVPLMYLPIIYYPIKDEDRATGFLLPTYGSSTLRGQAISNAFFWAIGRSQDATFFHDWFTRTGQGAGAEYRYVSGQASSGNFRFYHLDQHQAEFVQSGSTSILPAQIELPDPGQRATRRSALRIRLHQRIDYTSNLITKQLYQQNLYQASNATRTVEAGGTGFVGRADCRGAVPAHRNVHRCGLVAAVRQQPRGSRLRSRPSGCSGCRSTDRSTTSMRTCRTAGLKTARC